jgi:hypothetical protein
VKYALLIFTKIKMTFLKNLAKSYPALARMIEISVLGAASALITYLGNVVATNDYTDVKYAVMVFISTFVTGFLAGANKMVRDKQRALESESESLPPETI